MMAKGNRYEARLLPGVCKRNGISAQVELELQRFAEDLRVFKNTELIQPANQRKTSMLRAKQLVQIKELASALKQAFMELAYEDRWALNEEYHRRPGAPGRVFCFDAVTQVRLNNPDTVEPRYFALPEKVIPDIENAVINVLQRMVIKKYDGKPKRLADFIMYIAIILESTHIVPGTNEKFDEVCGAVFEDAGVTPSKRAMTHFTTKMLPSMLEARGLFDAFCKKAAA